MWRSILRLKQFVFRAMERHQVIFTDFSSSLSYKHAQEILRLSGGLTLHGSFTGFPPADLSSVALTVFEPLTRPLSLCTSSSLFRILPVRPLFRQDRHHRSSLTTTILQRLLASKAAQLGIHQSLLTIHQSLLTPILKNGNKTLRSSILCSILDLTLTFLCIHVNILS